MKNIQRSMLVSALVLSVSSVAFAQGNSGGTPGGDGAGQGGAGTTTANSHGVTGGASGATASGKMMHKKKHAMKSQAASDSSN
jgi:hypothetical protein